MMYPVTIIINTEIHLATVFFFPVEVTRFSFNLTSFKLQISKTELQLCLAGLGMNCK